MPPPFPEVGVCAFLARFRTELLSHEVESGILLEWSDGVTEQTPARTGTPVSPMPLSLRWRAVPALPGHCRRPGAAGLGRPLPLPSRHLRTHPLRPVPPDQVYPRWAARSCVSPTLVLAKLCASLWAHSRRQAEDIGNRWVAALLAAARRDFGLADHTGFTHCADPSMEYRELLLLKAWDGFLRGPSGIIERAAAVVCNTAAAATTAPDGGEPNVLDPPAPFSQEWLLLRLLPLLVPAEAVKGNYERLVKAISPPSVVSALARRWQPPSPLPHILTAPPCIDMLLENLPEVDSCVAEECVEAVFRLVCLAARAVVDEIVAPSVLAQGLKVLARCLSRCRSNGVALPFLYAVDAQWLITLLCDCEAKDAAMQPVLLPLLQDLLCNASR